MSYKKEDLDDMSMNSYPGCAPARAKNMLASPWGQLPPRGGGGLGGAGGDDDDEERLVTLRLRCFNLIWKKGHGLRIARRRHSVLRH